MIQNPILPGFHPDPSILRVEDDYYIATSTFEWFPGIIIYHSKDLKNWKALTHCLTRESQLDLRGIDSSLGVWAPCLTYNKEQKLFYMAYSLMYGLKGQTFDMDNFFVTSESIEGPWSEPNYLNSSGFDPSFLHDDDGRQWVVNLQWEQRMGYEHPGALVIQEYCSKSKTLIGKPQEIYRGGTDMGCQEGPHIYKHGGYYYIMTAEGGTGYGHAVVVGRSKSLLGPYEPDPQGPVITSVKEIFNERGIDDSPKPHRFNPDSELQKSGHGSLVETQDGEWYIAHLCSRPLLPEQLCPLGRETALQKVAWTDDGWIRMTTGNNMAQLETEEASGLPEYLFEQKPSLDDFDSKTLDVTFQTLRIPPSDKWLSLTERSGFLRLTGQGSLFSPRHNSLVARRIQSFTFQAETCVEFEPEHIHQNAGLTCFYSAINFYYLRIYNSESLGAKTLGITIGDMGEKIELLEDRVKIDNSDRVYLRVAMDHHDLQFYYSLDGNNWKAIGPVLDASKLSDEYGSQKFTGAFVGMFVQDMHTMEKYADFDYFEYTEV